MTYNLSITYEGVGGQVFFHKMAFDTRDERLAWQVLARTHHTVALWGHPDGREIPVSRIFHFDLYNADEKVSALTELLGDVLGAEELEDGSSIQ